jgi:TolA-binding protein
VDRIFKAGEISMGIGQGNLAVKYFQTVVEDHPEFAKAPEALFLCGFCEETLNVDTAKARQYYESFIRQFPQHRLAQDAKFSVQNLGLTDEQLIEQFEKANKQGS